MTPVIPTARQLHSTRPWLGVRREAGAGLRSQADGERWLGRQRVSVLRNFLAPADCRLPVKSCSRGFFNPSNGFLNTFPHIKSSWHRRGAIFPHATDRTAALDARPACLASPKRKLWHLAPPTTLLLQGSRQEQSQATRPGAPWHFQLLRERFTNSSQVQGKPKVSVFLAPGHFPALALELAVAGKGGTGCRSSGSTAASMDGIQSGPGSPHCRGSSHRATATKQGCLCAHGLWTPPGTRCPSLAGGRRWLLARAPAGRATPSPGYTKTREENMSESRTAEVLPRWREKKPQTLTFYLCFARSLLSFYF